MIDFEGCYFFSGNCVICVEAGTTNDSDYPFNITVHLQGGKSFGVKYKTKQARDEAKRVLLNRIGSDQRKDLEAIRTKLFLIEDCVKRTDKRTLKMWRLLRKNGGEDE